MQRKKWSYREDQILKQVMKNQLYPINWIYVERLAREKGCEKTVKQIKTRWVQYLNPRLSKNKWSKEELEMIFDQYELHANQWKIISKAFQGRSDNTIKNKFFSHIKRGLRNIFKLSGFISQKLVTRIVNNIKPRIVIELLKKKLVYVDKATNKMKDQLRIFDLLKAVSFNKYKELNTAALNKQRIFIHSIIYRMNLLNKKYLANRFYFEEYEMFDNEIIIVHDFLTEQEILNITLDLESACQKLTEQGFNTFESREIVNKSIEENQAINEGSDRNNSKFNIEMKIDKNQSFKSTNIIEKKLSIARRNKNLPATFNAKLLSEKIRNLPINTKPTYNSDNRHNKNKDQHMSRFHFNFKNTPKNNRKLTNLNFKETNSLLKNTQDYFYLKNLIIELIQRNSVWNTASK